MNGRTQAGLNNRGRIADISSTTSLNLEALSKDPIGYFIKKAVIDMQCSNSAKILDSFTAKLSSEEIRGIIAMPNNPRVKEVLEKLPEQTQTLFGTFCHSLAQRSPQQQKELRALQEQQAQVTPVQRR